MPQTDRRGRRSLRKMIEIVAKGDTFIFNFQFSIINYLSSELLDKLEFTTLQKVTLMYNEFAYQLGAAGSCIRDLAAYGDQRARIVGRENVFDFSIGNPSIPAPKEIADTVRQLLEANLVDGFVIVKTN